MSWSRSRFVQRKTRLALEALEAREVPAFYLVTGIGDDSGLTPTAGTGSSANPFRIDSLRSAIERANATPNVADVIRFDAELFSQTITLDADEDALTFFPGARTTVDGANRQIKVDGNGTNRFQRVFEVLPSGLATIKNLTVQNGIDTILSEGPEPSEPGHLGGGGIRNAGNLTLTNVTVTDNQSLNDFEGGGGIYNALGARLILAHSVVSGNTASNLGAYSNYVPGGAITNKGTMTITATTVKDNDAADVGGGVFNAGTLVITKSTISGNESRNPDNGEDGRDGGGIFNSGFLKMTNATISRNFAWQSGGGISNSSTGSMNLLNCTVTENSAGYAGGIRVAFLNTGETVKLRNTIVSGNANVSEQPSDLVGSFGEGPRVASIPTTEGDVTTIAASYCLIGTTSNINLNGAGNLLNITDPGLGDLQDNGGETFTHALLPGSPAINNGDPNTGGLPIVDQRGAPYIRVRGGRVDIGAFELQAGSFPSSLTGFQLLTGQRRYH